jgi:hypothetical protein
MEERSALGPKYSAYSHLDVTEEILLQNLIYGSSDDTDPASLVSSKSLNYAKGPSIHNPDKAKVELIPYTIKYESAVGPFGVDNYFCKVFVSVDPLHAKACFEERDWSCAVITPGDYNTPDYEQATIDLLADPGYVRNQYLPARISRRLVEKNDAYISVELDNLKTGNQYIDSWVDMRLYTQDRQMHPSNKMFIRTYEAFYVGIAARNSRRLPYNITCTVGNQYLSYADMTAEDVKLIASGIS